MSDDVFNNAVEAALAWQKQIHPSAQSGRRGDRAGRARLKRCRTLMDAVAEPQVHELLSKLRGIGLSPAKDDAAIVLAVVFSAIAPGNGSETLAALLGRGGADQQVLKPMRFQALLKAMRSGDRELQIQSLRRALKILGDKPFDQRRAAMDILFFNDVTARRWNYDYWQIPKTLEPMAAEANAS